MIYSYSEGDRLESPLTYMYTSFEDRNFLSAYARSREECFQRVCGCARLTPDQNSRYLQIARLGYRAAGRAADADSLPGAKKRIATLSTSHLATVLDLEQPRDPASPRFRPDPIQLEAQSVDTENLLLDLATALCLPGNVVTETQRLWMDRLVQRFEVTKHLYATYGPHLRKGTGEHKRISLYVIFAIGLAVIYRDTQNLRYLNCLLKLNDLLCSTIDRFATDPLLRIVVGCALTLEMGYVQALMSEKEIVSDPR